MLKQKIYNSGLSGKTIQNLRSATRLTHQNLFFQEDVLVNDTTGVVDLFNSNTQKIYWHETPVIYQDELDLDNQQSGGFFTLKKKILRTKVF